MFRTTLSQPPKTLLRLPAPAPRRSITTTPTRRKIIPEATQSTPGKQPASRTAVHETLETAQKVASASMSGSGSNSNNASTGASAPAGDTPVFNKDGAIGSAFKADGAIGSAADKVGGPFSKDGAVGKEFNADGAVGGTVQENLGKK